jgi:transcriptional regulator with XRE-family HTH domain
VSRSPTRKTKRGAPSGSAKSRPGKVPRPTKAARLAATGAEARIDLLFKEIEALRAQVGEIPRLREALQSVAAGLHRKPGQAGPAPSISEAPRKAQHKRPSFLLEWRLSRKFTLGDIAKAIGYSKSQLSRVENGLQAYTQPILEGYAETVGCRPSDLLSHPPFRPELALTPLFAQLRQARPETRALAFLDPLVEEEAPSALSEGSAVKKLA